MRKCGQVRAAQRSEGSSRLLIGLNQWRGKQKQEIPTNCGQATAGIVTVYPRNKKRADEAQRYFDSVIKQSNGIMRFEGPGRYARNLDLDHDAALQELISMMAAKRIYSDPTMVTFENLYVPENGDLSPAYAPFAGTLPPIVERPSEARPVPMIGHVTSRLVRQNEIPVLVAGVTDRESQSV